MRVMMLGHVSGQHSDMANEGDVTCKAHAIKAARDSASLFPTQLPIMLLTWQPLHSIVFQVGVRAS